MTCAQVASTIQTRANTNMGHQGPKRFASRRMPIPLALFGIVIEGVAGCRNETPAESQTCEQMGFDLGQGYLYGRPAPARV